MTMTAEEISCLGPHGFHKLAYYRWAGPASGMKTLCVHGLSRNGRDFDALAAALAGTRTVYAPDMPGRGKSPWLSVAEDYGYPLYLGDITALIARMDAGTIDYVGTSMGGIIGMMLASMPGSPIRRLVINDVGPVIPKEALERIGSYVGKVQNFADVAGVEAYLRRVHAPFGDLNDDQWGHLARHSARALEGGGCALAYDPAIANPFMGEMQDVDLWPVWDMIQCPVMVIRGAKSDLLRAETAEEMTRRGPEATLFTVETAGHAPALMAADQIAAVMEFLAE